MDWTQRLSQNLTEYESIPFWSWNDHLEPEELRRQIRAMKGAGIGGFFMHARGGLTTEYLGEDWFAATAASIDEAKKQGMHAWCYDENGWPSGFAGMKLLEDPANWAHYVTCETRETFDPAALAVYVREGSRLCRVRNGQGAGEYICLYDRTNSSVVDILNPEIVKKFIAETHEKYYERFGEEFGRNMQGFFTDEPQYFRWDTAYSPMMLAAYRERYGEDLLDVLGALFIDCDQAPRLRLRYWKLMNELYTDNFAGQIYHWCEAHNCQLTGHTIDENSLYGQMICCAGVMPFYAYEHIPGMDWLGRDISHECAPRQVSSVAQQMGKKHVLTETFACAGWDVTPRELKRIAEWQYVHGVNLMCQHLYPYSIRGQRKRDYPAFYSEHNPWVKAEFRRFNDYFTALGCMLADSREEADVAVLHPIHAAYLTYRRDAPERLQGLQQSFVQLVEALGAAGIGHHYVDELLLARYGEVCGDRLRMGEQEYRFVVIPEMETLDSATEGLLRQYVANGGKLYLQGKAPSMVEGEPADLSFLRANIAWEDMRTGRVRIDRQDTQVRFTTRAAEFGDFLFAVNLSQTESYAVEFRIRARGVKRFDAMERAYRPVHFLRDGQEIRVPVTFQPGESCILVLDDSAVSAPAPAPEKPVRALALEAEVVSFGENTLTLDVASLSDDGVNFSAPLPIMAVSDRLLRQRKNRRVYLKYAFQVEAVPDRIRLEAEKMGAERAWFNGEPILFDDPGTLDPAFVSANLAGRVRQGVNELVLEIQYYQPEEVYQVFNGVYYEHSDGTESLINCLSYRTDIEAVYVMGDFGVYAEGLESGPKHTLLSRGNLHIGMRQKRVSLDELAPKGYPFFGGEMAFELPFEARGDETSLALKGRYGVARVQVNDGETHALMFGDRLDVTGALQPGRNVLRIALLSSYRNLLGPFHFKPDPEPFGVSPDLFSGYGGWTEDGTHPQYRDSYAFTFFGVKELLLQ